MAGSSTRVPTAAFYNGAQQPPLGSWEGCKADLYHSLVHHLVLCTERTQLRNQRYGYWRCCLHTPLGQSLILAEACAHPICCLLVLVDWGLPQEGLI